MTTETETPYGQAVATLIAAGARRIAECPGPNRSGPSASMLEFWVSPHGGLVILQKWTGLHNTGSFDYYLQGTEHKTTKAIADMLAKREHHD